MKAGHHGGRIENLVVVVQTGGGQEQPLHHEKGERKNQREYNTLRLEHPTRYFVTDVNRAKYNFREPDTIDSEQIRMTSFCVSKGIEPYKIDGIESVRV